MESYQEIIKLTKLYFSENKFELCQKTIEPLILNSDCPEQLYIFLSKCYRKQKRFEINELLLLFALQKYKNSPDIRSEHAENAVGMHNFDEIILRWKYILDNKLFPNPSNIYCRLFDAYISTDDIILAEKYLDLASSIDSTYIQVINRRTQLDSYKAKKFIITISQIIDIDILKIKDSSLLIKMSDMIKYSLDISILKPIKSIIFITETEENEFFLSNLKTSEYEGVDQNIIIQCNLYTVKQIGVKLENNDRFILYTISRKEVFSVLEGSNSWLFLDNDTNKSVEIYTGKILLDNKQQDAWRNHLTKISNVKNSIFVLSPAKETVFAQFYPYVRGKLTITTQILDILQDINLKFIFPVEILKSDESTYLKVDTHWSQYGAFQCFLEIMKVLNIIEEFRDIFSFKEQRYCGDLGSKLIPIRYSTGKFLDYSTIHFKEIFSNEVSGSGIIKILENDQSLIKKKVVIFGSSFSLYLYPFFSEIFSRTVFMRYPVGCIQSILDFEQPDLVIFETTERFLQIIPKFYNHINDHPIAGNLYSLSEDSKQNLINKISFLDTKVNSLYIDYVKSSLSL